MPDGALEREGGVRRALSCLRRLGLERIEAQAHRGPAGPLRLRRPRAHRPGRRRLARRRGGRLGAGPRPGRPSASGRAVARRGRRACARAARRRAHARAPRSLEERGGQRTHAFEVRALAHHRLDVAQCLGDLPRAYATEPRIPRRRQLGVDRRRGAEVVGGLREESRVERRRSHAQARGAVLVRGVSPEDPEEVARLDERIAVGDARRAAPFVDGDLDPLGYQPHRRRIDLVAAPKHEALGVRRGRPEHDGQEDDDPGRDRAGDEEPSGHGCAPSVGRRSVAHCTPIPSGEGVAPAHR